MISKKVITAVATGAMFLASAGAAFANTGSSGGIKVTNTDTTVNTSAVAEASTGENQQYVGSEGGNSFHFRRSGRGGVEATQDMTSGDAEANANAYSNVNSTLIEADCGCLGGQSENHFHHRRGNGVGVEVLNDDTDVTTKAKAEAETGENSQYVGSEGSRAPRVRADQTMVSGNALANSWAEAWVNMTNITLGSN